jgi:hypothetical protein
VRLTLRTLLAYLDDTLEPGEIKEIGQKVAESDAAQELIARIKQSTRRRRLTTPPEKGNGARFDANTVADYLDNELPTDQVAELEKTCLESDVHLAEVAACHQILTLVLGEPALVPPTARERMYGLVKGREAIPFRKAAAPAAPDGADRDADDAFLLGPPFLRRRAGWLRWALPVAAALLLAALGVAVWQNLPAPRPPDRPDRVANGPNAPPPDRPAGDPDKKDPDKKDKDDKKDADKSDKADGDKDPDKKDDKTDKPDDKKGAGGALPKPAPPGDARVRAGTFVVPPKGMSVLLARAGDKEPWKRTAAVGGDVFTRDALVSLPGYTSEVHLDSGVNVELHGHVREFTIPQPGYGVQDLLLESAATLHKPEAPFDADLTLDRGRIYLSNRKKEGPAHVRLRFGGKSGEVWDLTLAEPDAEVGVDLMKLYVPGLQWKEGEEPLQMLYLYVLKGKAGLAIDGYHEFPNLQGPVGPALFSWDNMHKGAVGPQNIPQNLPIWAKAPPADGPPAYRDALAGMREALDLLNMRIDKGSVEAALAEGLQKDDKPYLRLLSVYSLGAVDQVGALLDVLADEKSTHAADRDAAVFVLRRWLARDAGNGQRLFDRKAQSGLLLNKKYRLNEAEDVLELLHDLPDDAVRQSATYERLGLYLNHDQMAIRQLAWWHLQRLAPGAKAPPYDPSLPAAQRQPAAEFFQKQAEEGKLPPPAPPTGKPGPGGP